DFKNIQRSYCEEVFERRAQGLIEKYAPGERYIATMLLDQKHTWVKCFTSRRFTAGTQSTQRVEFENSLVQKAVQSIPISEALLFDDDSFEPFFEQEPSDDLEIPVEADEDREFNLQSLIMMLITMKLWKFEKSSIIIIQNEDQRIQAELIRQQESLNKQKLTTPNNPIINANWVLLDCTNVLDSLRHRAKGRPPSK
ncbi:11787_t:CDS:2, partial [Racocetra fulgida]